VDDNRGSANGESGGPGVIPSASVVGYADEVWSGLCGGADRPDIRATHAQQARNIHQPRTAHIRFSHGFFSHTRLPGKNKKWQCKAKPGCRHLSRTSPCPRANVSQSPRCRWVERVARIWPPSTEPRAPLARGAERAYVDVTLDWEREKSKRGPHQFYFNFLSSVNREEVL